MWLPHDDPAPSPFPRHLPDRRDPPMRATLMYGAGDVRVEDVPDARLIEPTDALVRVTRAAICGSDLWPYKSMPHDDAGRRMGHEFIGVVDAVGSDVANDQGRRSGRLAVPLVGRQLRLLPGRAAERVSARRQVRLRRRRRRPGRGGARPAGGRHAGRAAGRRRRRADAVAADARGRDGHRPPRRARGEGRAGQDRRRRRRWRRRPVRCDRRQASRRGADHPARQQPGPDRARAGVRRH